MGELADRFRLTMDTDVSQGISLHLSKDKVISFTKFMRGVYYYDTKNNHSNVNEVNNYSLCWFTVESVLEHVIPMGLIFV